MNSSLADNISIQPHSEGPLYPYILVARQHGDGLEWGIIGPDTDGYFWVGSAEEAERWAAASKGDYDSRQAAAKVRSLTDHFSAAMRAAVDRILRRNQREWDLFSAQRG